MRDRYLLVPAALLVAANYGWDWLWRLWVQVLSPGARPIHFEWFDQSMLVLWGLLFALSLVMGFLVVALTRPTKPVATSFVLGVLLALLLLRALRFVSTPDSTIWVDFWNYGLFLMAPIGAMAGALLAVKSLYGREAAV
jgi:hypothetical protein